MTKIQLKILVFCYTFPPNNSIGGRRWAKFLKCFKEMGVQIHVICQESHESDDNFWLKDLEAFEDNIVPKDLGYPKVMSLPEYNIAEKIQYRITRRKLEKKVKGNIYDRTCTFRLDDNQWIEKMIEEKGVNTIVVSGGPFAWMSELLGLKINHPELKFVADFRDPWTNNASFFGYSDLAPARLEYEKAQEKKVIREYDLIWSVHQEMNAYFTREYKRKDAAFEVISNGWDRDDRIPSSRHESKPNNLVFAGNLYDPTFEVFRSFIEVLSSEKILPIIKSQSIQIDFYGSVPKWFFDLTTGLDFIQFRGKINPKEVNELLSSSVGAFLFLTDDLGFSLSTKFFEYLKYEMPIFVVNSGGETGLFVDTNGLGSSLKPESMSADVLRMLELINAWEIQRPEWVEKYEIRTIAKKMLSSLHDLAT